GVGPLGGQHPQGHVADELAVEAVLDLAGGYLGALDLPGERGGVDADGHRDGRVVDGDERQRARVVQVDERLPDGDVLDAGDGDDVPGVGAVGGHPVERDGPQQLGDPHRLDVAVAGGPADGLPLVQRAVEDAQQRQPAEERGGVEVGDVCLEGCALV